MQSGEACLTKQSIKSNNLLVKVIQTLSEVMLDLSQNIPTISIVLTISKCLIVPTHFLKITQLPPECKFALELNFTEDLSP